MKYAFYIERRYFYNFWWFPWQPISRWCRTQWAQNLQKWDSIHIGGHRERNEIMTPVTLLKIYIYSSTSKKCGGTSGGSGCMHAREGSSEPFYSESSNFFVYNYHVNSKITTQHFCKNLFVCSPCHKANI